MDDAANRAAERAVQRAIAAMGQTSGPPEPAEPAGPQKAADPFEPAEKGGTEKWNSKDVGFFDPNFEGKSASTDAPLKHSGKDTYYRDVYVFVERMKEMAVVLKANIVRRNLSSCLRGIALMWHTAELFDITKRILTYGEGVEEWVQALITRFKPQASTATAALLKERYTMEDARRHRELREYAQKIIRWAKTAEMPSVFNQLNVIYNGVDVRLRRDLARPINTMSLDDYLQVMDSFKDIWWDLAAEKFDKPTKGQGYPTKGYGRGLPYPPYPNSPRVAWPGYGRGYVGYRPSANGGQQQRYQRYQQYVPPGGKQNPLFPFFSFPPYPPFQPQAGTFMITPQQPANVKAIMPPPNKNGNANGNADGNAKDKPDNRVNQRQRYQGPRRGPQ